MAKKTIYLGAAANDRTGAKLRSGGESINENFSELFDFKDSAGTFGLTLFTAALQSTARNNLELPFLVPNGYTPASLVTALAGSKTVEFAPGATVTLTSTAHRLTQTAGGTLNLNGAKVAYNYSDLTANTNFNATSLRNGTIEIGAGYNIYRLLRFQQDDGRLDDVTVQAGNFIENGASTNDAAIRVEGKGFSSRNLTLKNMRNGCMVIGQDAYFENFKAYAMTKGLIGNGGSAVVNGFTFDGTGSVSTTDPGHNAIGGNYNYLSVNNFRIRFMGEHGIYVAGLGKAANQYVSFTNGYISYTGQCSFKGKDFSWVHAFNINATYTSYGNSPDLNEEGFRFQRNARVTGGALNITKEIVDGVPTGNAGWAHIFLAANDVVELLVENCAEGSGRGVYIGFDDITPTLPNGRIDVRVRHKNLGGPSIEIAGGAVANVSISGTTLTVNSVTEGALAVKQPVIGVGIAEGTYITAYNAGAGTYTVSVAQTVSNVAVKTGPIINDVITIYTTVDGCPGPPVIIGSVVNYGPNGKMIGIGTYKGCGAPPPIGNANVDLTQLVPADVLNPREEVRDQVWVTGGTSILAQSNSPEITVFSDHSTAATTYAVVLPVAIKDGQKVNLRVRSGVNTLTVTAAAGSVYGAPTTFSAGGHASMVWRASLNAWFRAE